jgi:hypothetical protein
VHTSKKREEESNALPFNRGRAELKRRLEELAKGTGRSE